MSLEKLVHSLIVVGDRVLAQGEVPGLEFSVNDLADIGRKMSAGQIDRVFALGKRVGQTGDAACAPGAYALAVLTKFHGLPFFVVHGEGSEVVPGSLITAWIFEKGIFLRDELPG